MVFLGLYESSVLSMKCLHSTDVIEASGFSSLEARSMHIIICSVFGGKTCNSLPTECICVPSTTSSKYICVDYRKKLLVFSKPHLLALLLLQL